MRALLGMCTTVTLVPSISTVQVAVGSMQEPSRGFYTLVAERMNGLHDRRKPGIVVGGAVEEEP